MTPRAHVAHHSPGRTRFKVTSKTWDREYFLSAMRNLQKLSEIKSAKVNYLTGSIVVFHDLDLQQLMELLEKQCILQACVHTYVVANESSFESALQTASKNLDRDLKKVTGGEIDLQSVIAFSYFGFSLVQLRRKSFLPAAWVLAMHGLDTLKRA